MLQLTTEEATLLRAIASRNDAGSRHKERELRGAAATVPSEAKATTAAGARVEKNLRKTETAAELDRLERIRAAGIQAERESLHKKSKFTTFVRRAPGSFEGGKS
jgi:hypothetical protein